MAKLNEAALLWRGTIHQWYGEHVSREMADHIRERCQGEGRMARATLLMWYEPSLKRISKEMRPIKRHIQVNTMPWDNLGTKLIPCEQYIDFQTELKAMWRKVDKVLDEEFRIKWDQNLEKTRTQLGIAFDESFYQGGPESFISRYWFESATLPIPSADDWRIELEDEHEMEVIKKSTEQAVQAAAQAGLSKKWKELRTCIERMAGMTHDPKANFRSGIVTSLEDCARALRSMNFQEDEFLADTVHFCLTKLNKFHYEDIRDNLMIRTRVRLWAIQVLGEMDAHGV